MTATLARSLHWRLLAGAAAAILLALCAAWLFMTLLFERHIERRLQDELARDGRRLVAALSLDADGAPSVDPVPMDPRLLTPAGGYYWQVSSDAGAARSRSLWDGDLSQPPAPPTGDDWRMRRSEGPFGEEVSLLERAVVPDADGPQVLVQLAQDRAPLAAARREFGRELALFLLALWLVLSLAAWLQVRLGLRPLGHIRGDLAALRASASARLPEARLREIQPLTDAINALADARERDLELARHRAADLAHGLKTPLSAIAAQSRRARESGAEQAADGIDRGIAAIRRTIDAELARARAASLRGAPGGDADLRTVAERLVTVIEHTDKGGELAFAIDIPAGLRLAVPADVLSEILGAVLENAARHARRQVRIAAAPVAEGTVLTIEDDGPGFTPGSLETMLARGGRLDESGPGSGLGLSIARELAEAGGGRLALSSSSLGGALVRIDWRAA
ncbi:sensor histidine kinase [Pseudoxanthomonas sangjuensis]|uniref:sensor histidine kinase n=1 Tax=Pseudoxanthomonas sangjuensis TaxID=1503750 RepID=UPI001391A640|nr:HAMP domain-containing sensor histidine kinase [Pseudoxanthomonas sangjuensis]KAF1715046.1 ATP-binding protein [Pseudoxanthomonas sangjuensis]